MRRLPRMTWTETGAAAGRRFTPFIGDIIEASSGQFGLWAGISEDGHHGWMIPLQVDTGRPISPRRSLVAVWSEEILQCESLDDGHSTRTVYQWLARADELYPNIHDDVINQPMPAVQSYQEGDFLLDPNEPDKPVQLLYLHRGHYLVQGFSKLPVSLTQERGADLWTMLVEGDSVPQMEVSCVPRSALAGFLLAEHEPLDKAFHSKLTQWLHTPRRGSWVMGRLGSRRGSLIRIAGPSAWEVQWEGSEVIETVVPDQLKVYGWSPL
jgi:hypothetical protein